MTSVECDKFASKVESICDRLGHKKRTRKENTSKIKEYVAIVDTKNVHVS